MQTFLILSVFYDVCTIGHTEQDILTMSTWALETLEGSILLPADT